MTVYWVDPYIDCNNGGIHGTTSSTTRSGTYSAPWGLYDIMQTSNSAVSTVNGTTLVHGDEIRLKGQAANLFNWLSRDADLGITEWASGYMGIDGTNTTDQTYVDTARGRYSNYNANTPLYMYKDSGMKGNYDFLLFSGNTSFSSYSAGSIVLPTYNTDRNPWYGLYRAKLDPVNGTSGGAPTGDSVGIIDPIYFFDVRADFTTSTCYFCNFDVHVIVTDGWDSSTTRNGVTIIPFGWRSTSGSQIYLRYNTGSGGGYRQRIDCPNTFWIRFNPTGAYNGGTTYVQVHNMGDSTSSSPSADTWFRMGQVGDMTSNAWSYWQSNTSATTPSGYDYLVDIGVLTLPRYHYYQYSGNSSAKPKIRYQNVYQGQGWYSNGNNTQLTIGNFLTYRDYTSGFCIANMSSTNEVSFMDNAHIYSYTGATAFTSGTVVGTNLNTVTHGVASSTQPTAYPGHTNNAGPAFGAGVGGGDMSSSGWADNSIQLKPAYWLETGGINLPNTTSTLPAWGGPDVRGVLGVANSDGGNTDYRNYNVKLYMKRQTYGHINRPIDNIATLMGNNYDGQPIEVLPSHTTNTSAYQNALIAYNDSNGDYVIQCSDYGQQFSVSRAFEFEVPSGASTNGISFSIDVDRSGSSTNYPNGNVYSNNGASSNRHAISFSPKGDGSGYTGTCTIPAANISADSNYMKYNILVVNGNTDDYTVKYTIKSPTVT